MRPSLLFLVTIFACKDKATTDDTGNDGDADTDTDSDTDTDTDTDADAPTHDADIQPIWDSSCSGCHTGGGSSGGMALDDGYTATVGVPSGELSTMNRVEAGDIDNSYLWHKLEGTHEDVGGSGAQMPKGSTLDADSLATIKAWIEGGALQ